MDLFLHLFIVWFIHLTYDNEASLFWDLLSADCDTEFDLEIDYTAMVWKVSDDTN